MTREQRIGLILLRVTIAVIILIHGAARLWSGGVAPFGEFLKAQGNPIGPAAAWMITLMEIFGGAVLAAGYCVFPLCAFFFVQIAMGIAMVHAREGWFVVGLGRNGMEFSVLILAVLACVALTDSLVKKSVR